MSRKPIYICLTGMDGSGKTTQARAVVGRCAERSLDAGYVWARWEPFFVRPVVSVYFKKKGAQQRDGEGFEKAKDTKAGLLRRPWLRRAWRGLSLLDYWLTKRPRVALAARKWDILVLDRYVYDYAVDQALNLRLSPAEMVEDLDRRIFARFPRPDLTIVLQLSAEDGARRKEDGTGVEYLAAREPYYRAIAQRPGAVAVDASGSLETVQDAVWSAVEEYLAGGVAP